MFKKLLAVGLASSLLFLTGCLEHKKPNEQTTVDATKRGQKSGFFEGELVGSIVWVVDCKAGVVIYNFLDTDQMTAVPLALTEPNFQKQQEEVCWNKENNKTI